MIIQIDTDNLSPSTIADIIQDHAELCDPQFLESVNQTVKQSHVRLVSKLMDELRAQVGDIDMMKMLRAAR